MKRLTLILIIILSVGLMSACNAIVETPENSGNADADNNADMEIGDNNENMESFSNGDDTEENCTNGEEYGLGDINVHELLSKRLEEVIAILGPDYSEPFFHAGAPSIYYEDTVCISYFKDVKSMEQGLRIQPEADVVAVGIFLELDVYKGISVGKTLDEINSNPDLLNQLDAVTVDIFEDDILRAAGIYYYEDSCIMIHLTFNEEMVCNSVFIKKENDPSVINRQELLL